ncbi:ABC transporter permease [Bacillus kwashiorkori]|uniref:ABC transporter permease n=1 Tax=Bacillus kwashiorkori TaxID=1522318 RepID=UPI0007864B47|nr:ABC transporter permease [Bacillus kwashiorkori]
MNNFWIVLSHTYTSKVKTKQFIISTLITLGLIFVLANITNIIDAFEGDGGNKDKIAVLDETGQLLTPFQNMVTNITEDIEIVPNSNESELEKMVLDGDLDAIVILQLDENGLPKATYKAKSLMDYSLPEQINLALQQVRIGIVSEQLNLSTDQLQLLNEQAEMEQIAIGENVKSEEEISQARGLVYILLFFIYFAVIMYASMIATEVATEKSSRVMEILISSVSPVSQMFGKIIGVALVGLTQLAVWLGVGYIAIKQNLDEMTGGFFSVFGFENISLSTIIYALIFFLLGFFLYATMAAFLGSIVSRIEDVNQAVQPMIWLVVIGFMLAMFGLSTPDATYITITSYIPIFTPMIMFMRVGLLDLPLWEPLLSIALTILTIVLLAIFGARVYKGGVLMYGSSNALKDIKKALQLSKKE